MTLPGPPKRLSGTQPGMMLGRRHAPGGRVRRPADDSTGLIGTGGPQRREVPRPDEEALLDGGGVGLGIPAEACQRQRAGFTLEPDEHAPQIDVLAYGAVAGLDEAARARVRAVAERQIDAEGIVVVVRGNALRAVRERRQWHALAQ